VLKQFGVDATFMDMQDPAKVREAIRPNTRLVWMETPSNPMLKVFDIAAIAEVARHKGIPLAVDNTFATPILQRPLELGATMVVHSMTKYLNGHSDVVGGAVITADDALGEKLHFIQKAAGGVPSPFDCYLVLRGLKTLAVRMQRHTASARVLASWLAGHPQVERVHYPGLASHPGHALASRQMKGPGGMISFELRGGLEASRAFLNREGAKRLPRAQLVALALAAGAGSARPEHGLQVLEARLVGGDDLHFNKRERRRSLRTRPSVWQWGQ